MNRSALAMVLPLVSLCGLVAHAGCSSEDTVSRPVSSVDSGGADTGSHAAVDSGPADTGTGAVDSGSAADAGSNAAACADYCQCMDTTCAAKKPANCVQECEAQTTWDLSCRTTHCGLASTDPTTHCPHAAGEAPCQ
jgi:hypothetical protein